MKNYLTVMAALASAFAAPAAFAGSPFRLGDQSTQLTIYGVADLGVGYYLTSGQSKTTLNSSASGSRLGFLAEHDLGDGFRVSARIEAGINLDTGTPSSTSGTTNRMWGRQAYLSFESPRYGAIHAGRLQGPTYDFFPRFDPMLLPPVDSWGVLTTLGFPSPGGASGNGQPGGFLINPTLRTENSLEYISPRLSGLQLKTSYSLTEGVVTQPRLADASLDYENGPLVVGLLITHASGTSGAGAIRPTDGVTETAFAASYQFGPVNPYLTVIRRDKTDPTLAPSGQVMNKNDEKIVLLGATIPVSAKGTVRLTAGRYFSGVADHDATSLGAGYTYDVDSTLMLLVAYSRLNQEGGGQWPIFLSPKPNAGAPVSGFLVGANWRF